MGILHWIMRHLLLLIVLAGVAFGVVYRKELAQEFGYQEQLAQVERDLNIDRLWPTTEGPLVRMKPIAAEETAAPAEPAPAPKAPAQKATAKPAPAPVKAAPPAPKPAPAPVKVAAPAPTPTPAPAKAASPAPKPVAAAEPAPAPVPEPEAVATAEPPAEKAPAPAPEKAPAPAAEPAPQTAEAASAPSLRDGWIAARRAYAAGDTDKAAGLYQALVDAYPDQADLPGELGNLYLEQGDVEKAAESFYQAGLRMLDGANTMRANTVLGVLNRLDPAKADALRKKMFAAMRGPAIPK